jgi:hypothetical protein
MLKHLLLINIKEFYMFINILMYTVHYTVYPHIYVNIYSTLNIYVFGIYIYTYILYKIINTYINLSSVDIYIYLCIYCVHRNI